MKIRRITKAKMEVQKNKETNTITNLISMNVILQEISILTSQLARGLILSRVFKCLEEAKEFDSNAIHIYGKTNELCPLFTDYDKAVKLFLSKKPHTAAKKQQALNLAMINIDAIKRNIRYILLMTCIGISHKNKIIILEDIRNLYENIKNSISYINDHIKTYNETSDIKLEFNVKWI